MPAKHRKASRGHTQSPVSSSMSNQEVGASGCGRKGVTCFAGDLPEEEQKLVWATHYAPAVDLFSRNAPGVAWKSKPSWYIVVNKDRTVQPELERFLAKRMNASTHAVDSSHVPMLSHPGFVVDVIRAVANSVKESSAKA